MARQDPHEIDDVIAQMRKLKLDIIIERTLEDFLGINFDRQQDGTIHLIQQH